jgi:DNA repair protein RadC
VTYEIVSKRRKNNPAPVRTPDDAYNLIKRYRDAPQEQFVVITLNGAHEPITVSIASIGLVNRTIVHPREVFVRAVRDMAAAVIICHNHPSGLLCASPEDNEITERVCKAGELLGINVLDHIIFSKNGYASLRTEGYFKNKGGTVMRRRYAVKTRFAFNGTFFITAGNKSEAKEFVEKHCGLVIGGNIHSTLPDDDVDWDFLVHPEKTVRRISVSR